MWAFHKSRCCLTLCANSASDGAGTPAKSHGPMSTPTTPVISRTPSQTAPATPMTPMHRDFLMEKVQSEALVCATKTAEKQEEVDALRRKLADAEAAVRSARRKLPGDDDVKASPVYVQLQSQLGAMTAELNSARKAVEAKEKECHERERCGLLL